VAAANLYAARFITPGTLLAVFLAAATAGTILFARSQSEQSQKGGGSRPGMMELAEPAQPDGALFTQ
jgi:hypothetical protein